MINELSNCTLCPRNCHANRFTNKLGYCKSDASINVASICLHKGEEPAICGKNGICNVFFTRCNLQCIYCQNYQISKLNNPLPETKYTLDAIVERIISILNTGCNRVGFVSASHFVPQMCLIIEKLRTKGHFPTFVMNTNAYDKVETLRRLEEYVDIYLPDFKYLDSKLAADFSDAIDYPQVAASAIKEMYRQKGGTLACSDTGEADFGLIIRHLVLPNHIENSKHVLRFIAENISTKVHISLMSQYYPINAVLQHLTINRTLTEDEYNSVINEFETLGFTKGWIQEINSAEHYRPDFHFSNPFE